MPTTAYALFDFDGTLIDGDSILHWLRFYYRRRPWRRVFQIANFLGLFLYLARAVNSHTLKRVFLWPMSFEAPAELDALASAFVREDLAFRFRRPLLERLWAHHFLGHKVVVISASGTFYLRHIQAVLPPCQVLGSELEWGQGPWRFPVYRDGNLRGENKIRRLTALGLGQSGASAFAYSDHHHDMPLLRFAAFPICVRPTARLRRRARSFGWPIWNWPGGSPAWKRKLESLLLLLLAWEPEADRAEGAILPGRPMQDTPAFLAEHVRALRERLRGQAPEVVERILGPRARRE
jgi:HAD superfamily phosphoserine phosphatase-like hydrolase